MLKCTNEKIKNPDLFQEAMRIYRNFYGNYPKEILVSANTDNKLGIQDIKTRIEVIIRDVDAQKNPDGIDKHLNEVRILEQGLKQGKLLDYNFCCDKNNLVKTAYIIKKVY
ncbi:MAG: hypothetical protein ACP5OZ_01805 [Candidatus Woesearchaeota archaeon]